MAKGKKQSLSAEELLKQALVPEGEQPYEVPKNWCWVKFNNLKDSDTSFFDGDWILSENMDPNGNVRLIQLSDIGIGEFLDKSAKFISEHTFNELDCSQLCEGDVLISRMAEPIARSCILPKLPMKCITAVDVAVMRCNSTIVLNKYVNYLCNASWFTDLANNLARGTTRVRITRKNLGDMPFPLPPLAEQQRIVDRIESLFTKLDQAKELAQNTLDSFETRKAAILHKAFTGELTAKWREEHGVSLDSWEEKELGDVCTSLQYGTSNKSSTEGKVVVIRMGNLQDGEIDWKNLAYTDNQEDIRKYLLEPGDVLFNRTNSPELVGKTSIYRGEYPAIFAGYIIRLKYDKQINGEYLNYIMNSVRAKEYCNTVKSDGVNQSNINAKKIAAFTIPVPSLKEQQEIVRILNRILDSEKNAKGIIDVIDRIEQMKKAILSRAFRGELGTNDPNEESALDLLKEVIVAQ